MAEFRDEDWMVLLDSIGQGRCVMLLGPDLEVATDGGDRRNLAAELSRKMAARLLEDYGVEVEDPAHLAQVAQGYEHHAGTADFPQALAAAYYEQEVAAPDRDQVFEGLADLPISLYVTSRHDFTLDEFLRRNQRFPLTERYHFRGDNERHIRLGSVEQPLVYRLFGWTRDRSSMVLTENDLLDFLVNVVSQNPRIPDNLQNEFTDPENSFLFLGFGLRHWYLRILLHSFRMSSARKRSFALEEGLEQKSTVLFYRFAYKAIKLVDADPAAFVAELRRRCDAERARWRQTGEEPQPPRRAASMAEAPSVFVSYLSENQEEAKPLFDALRGHGIEPWLDEENLRVGDLWDPKLKQAIEACDYFIVLQSRELAARDKSYVYKEVAIALEQQRLQRPDLVFILPLRIDDVAHDDGSPGCVESLRGLQTRDLRTDEDLSKLVSQILRDREKRAKKT